MTRDVNLNENKKAQELISTILRVFPEARILTPAEIKKLKQGKLKSPARKGSGRETARAGWKRRWDESYDLFDLEDGFGGGT